MRSSNGIIYSNLCDTVYGRCCGNRSIFMEETAMTMRCVLAKTDVNSDIKNGEEFSERAYCEDHRTMGVVCQSSTGVLCTPHMRNHAEILIYSCCTFLPMRGTPNRITLFNPFWIKGPKNPSSLLTPQRRWPGNVAISVLASGSSVMKIGYMSIDFASWRRPCHDRESGCW